MSCGKRNVSPSPRWGGVRGGGMTREDARRPSSTSPQVPHPTPGPSPSRGGEKWGIVRSLFLALVASAFATPAFAASGIGGAIDPVIYELMVFVMAIFVGYYVVWAVTPALHTPLMSVTNAISSVIVVGALLAVAVENGAVDGFLSGDTLASKTFGVLALIMASINIFGGFLVTQRMLAMYKKKGDKK